MRPNPLPIPAKGKVSDTSESGQALIETAISLTMLIVMLLGVVEIAGLAYTAIQVTNAARAAVQYGDQNIGTKDDKTGMKTAAALEAPYLPNLNTLPSSSCICANGTACDPSATPSCGILSNPVFTIHVTTSTTYTPFIDLPGLPSSYTLYGEAYQQVLSN